MARGQAWLIKRLVSLFTRAAARGHYPREMGMRAIFEMADIPLPSDPRFLAHRSTYICLQSPFPSVVACTTTPQVVAVHLTWPNTMMVPLSGWKYGS